MAKVFIEETTLTAIGDAIRGKTGKTDLIDPALMSTEIANIPAGGGSDDIEPVVLTDNCERACSGPLALAFIESFPTKVSTKDITDGKYMFSNYKGSSIPFDINFKQGTQVYMQNMFYMSNLETPPKVLYAKPNNYELFFNNCQKLKSIPEDFTSTWDWSRMDTQTSAYSGNASAIFNNCYALRNVPRDLIAHGNPKASPSYTYFYNGFTYCYALDALEDLPLPFTANMTSNVFYNSFNSCNRLKKLTFELENGAPKVMPWKSQTITLSSALGYTNTSAASFVNYTGIPLEKEVTDAASYEALKNDPDWWSRSVQWSRYNHASAVETINSLPDTSAYLAANGGTNTIAFAKNSGFNTGGAVGDLTEEEIAVAAAKGWTVTLS